MKQVIVRYRVKPDQAAKNAELVRAVYEELRQVKPSGLHYGTFQLADGVTFVHMASHDDDGQRTLTGLASFKRFQEGIAARCDEPPAVSEAREIGSFELFGE